MISLKWLSSFFLLNFSFSFSLPFFIINPPPPQITSYALTCEELKRFATTCRQALPVELELWRSF